MIKTRKELRECLEIEKAIYLPAKLKWERILLSENEFKLYQYVRLLRYTEFHYNNKRNIIHKILYAYYRRRKSIQGRKLGIEMWENTFGPGLKIFHAGNIVINGKSRIGKNFKLHGDNCVGNSGRNSACPVIGNNVALGVGAKVIGNVTLADNITVAAGAVVIRSCLTPGAVLAGVPAKCVKVSE